MFQTATKAVDIVYYKDTKELLIDAVDKNIIVLDADATPSHLTKKLFQLMKEVAWENYKSKIKYFVLHRPLDFDAHTQIYVDKDLNTKEMSDFYTITLNASFPYGKTMLMIGMCENGIPLLGSF